MAVTLSSDVYKQCKKGIRHEVCSPQVKTPQHLCEQKKASPHKDAFLLGSANVEAWHLEPPAILIYEVAALKQEDLVDEPDT